MRILILGKNGLLGHELINAFGRDDLFALGSEELDIRDRERVFEKFMTIQPDVVINATGYTNVDEAEKEEEKANEVNGQAVSILAQGCREIGAVFVHFSTDYVFRGDMKKGYSEDAVTHPLNAYGRSKELGEKFILDEMELETSEVDAPGKYFIIRTSWLFGKHGKNFVDTMLKLGVESLKTGKELKVVNDQHGKPTYAADLAQQVKWLVDSREYPSGIYHITNEGETSWYNFAKTIFEVANMPVTVIPCSSSEYPRPALRPQYSILINTKLPPLRPWKEALTHYISSL